MYTVINFRTKKQLKEAVAAGRQITVYQPNADLTGAEVPENGTVYLEGPHYPEPHRWYAEAILIDGKVVKVRQAMDTAKYDDTYTDSVTPDGVLVGCCHYCPICFRQLHYNPMPDIGETYWQCPSCNWWDTGELIKMMMENE